MSKFKEFRSKNKLTQSNDNSLFINIGNNESHGNKAIENLVKQARKSGSLNLANRSISEIPMSVYRINFPNNDDTNSINFEQNDSSWWDDVFLSKLILTANSISFISDDISLLDKLAHLDVSDNKISTLPSSITKLSHLKHLNISKNKIQMFPDNIENLKELQILLGAYNVFKSFPEGLGCLVNVTTLDLSHNELGEFPSQITKLICLNKLDLSYNQITSLPYTLERLQKLQVLDLSQNKLQTISEGFSAPVEQIWLHVNRLTKFPIVSMNKNLKEISLTHNMISEITTIHLSNMPNICTLTIANNKIADLPEEISTLPNLSNLDLSNNDLKTLPLTLGNMDGLKCLSVDGNPFRMIKRSIINSGAESIKRYLRMRNTQEEEDKSFGPGLQALNRATINDDTIYLDQTDFRATGILKLSSKNLTDISDDILNSLDSVSVKGLNLNSNKFISFPTKIFKFSDTLNELDLSNNQITELPSTISCLRVLRRLDISYNKIRKLPDSLIEMKNLTQLILSYNDIGGTIPDVISRMYSLQNLAMSHCGLAVLDHNKIKSLNKLEILDISNNAISIIPPELGLCEKIKSLNLDGNCFKVPRPAIISKGTASVLEYLRSRIVMN